MCFNNFVSILNRPHVKKTDDINRLNRARSHTDGDKDFCKKKKKIHKQSCVFFFLS